MKKKVLHVLSSDMFSGAENVACQIIKLLSAEGFESAYCSPDGQIRDALKERDISFIPMKNMSISEVRKAINKSNPDMIHAHDMKASFTVSCACGRIPMISHIHNNAYDARRLSLKSVLYYTAAQKARHIFWVSHSACSDYVFSKAFALKSTVLPNIVDIEEIYRKLKLDKTDYYYDVVFIGRLTYQKNPQRLIDVLDRIVQKRSEIQIAIIGTGEAEEKIRNLVIARNLTKNIIFLGFQDNPIKILASAKVMIMTSRWEGTPICALEAMTLGVPIVSTPTDGLCDLVTNGITGYLSDDNEKLAEYCLEIITNKPLYKELSQGSLQVIQKLMNKDKYKSQIAEIYKKED